jgi:hypothetical protein
MQQAWKQVYTDGASSPHKIYELGDHQVVCEVTYIARTQILTINGKEDKRVIDTPTSYADLGFSVEKTLTKEFGDSPLLLPPLSPCFDCSCGCSLSNQISCKTDCKCTGPCPCPCQQWREKTEAEAGYSIWFKGEFKRDRTLLLRGEKDAIFFVGTAGTTKKQIPEKLQLPLLIDSPSFFRIDSPSRADLRAYLDSLVKKLESSGWFDLHSQSWELIGRHDDETMGPKAHTTYLFTKNQDLITVYHSSAHRRYQVIDVNGKSLYAKLINVNGWHSYSKEYFCDLSHREKNNECYELFDSIVESNKS